MDIQRRMLVPASVTAGPVLEPCERTYRRRLPRENRFLELVVALTKVSDPLASQSAGIASRGRWLGVARSPQFS